ncbi:MAG TPA: glycosyltransferase [Tepidisphaeraceae bacterium]|jgi:UDP:flavonoid glycosyltransferase YjiC (YdhE family)
MHAILTSIGTDGDIIPYVGIGAELRRRGHRVTLAVAEPWQSTAAELGLEFSPIFTAEEDRQMLAMPDFWHPIKGPQILARWGAQFFNRQYLQLADLCKSPDSVLIANPGLIPARVVSEKLRTPLAHLILQPWMIKSSIAPPVMPAGLTLPRWAPRMMSWGYWRVLNLVGDLLLGKELNRLRHTLGMQPVHRVFDWWLSEQMVIGMFPEWYGQRQADWIAHVRLAGFPMFDGRPSAGLSPELEAFCREGEPPIVFTFGTGMMHGHALFQAAVETCAMLGKRGILLSRHTSQLPDPLPATICWQAFAPFQELFPHCAAVVHHGGIGTTAKALASATPQLIVPIAYDQLDNATRIKRLGVGNRVRSRKLHSARLAPALAALLSSDVKRTCITMAAKFNSDEGVSRAAGWIEEFALTHAVPSGRSA